MQQWDFASAAVSVCLPPPKKKTTYLAVFLYSIVWGVTGLQNVFCIHGIATRICLATGSYVVCEKKEDCWGKGKTITSMTA